MTNECPNCGYKSQMSLKSNGNENYANFGHICSNCGYEIEGSCKFSVVQENETKKEALLEQVIEKIRKKIKREGDSNAN